MSEIPTLPDGFRIDDHYQLPWQVVVRHHDGRDLYYTVADARGYNILPSLYFPAGAIGFGVLCHIVRCVNAHDDLVKAQAEAALKLAKGE